MLKQAKGSWSTKGAKECGQTSRVGTFSLSSLSRTLTKVGEGRQKMGPRGLDRMENALT